jgi:hypothetical protein
MTTVLRTTIFGPVHDNGTFTPASAVPAPPAVLTDSADLAPPAFPTARKGYAPTAVDAHLALLAESLSTLRTALADSERRRAMAEQHAVAVEEEIRVVRAGQSPADTGFGARAERMLRLAETEAEQIRITAHRTAAEVTERAQGEAERHRHDVRQQLIAENARSEEQAARRASELQDREGALGERLTRVRAEADAVRLAAERAADAHRAGAQADVEELRRRAAEELGRARAQAEHELARLRDLQGVARAELARVATTIRAELASAAGPVVPAARPSPRPTRRVETPAVDGPPPGRARHSDGEPPSDDTTPHRYAAAGC